MSLEARTSFIINALYFLLMAAIFYVAVKYFFGLVAPFILGLLVSAVLHRSIRFLSARLRLPKKLGALFCITLFYVIIGFLVFWLGVSVRAWVKDLMVRLPSISPSDVEPVIAQFFGSIEG